MTKSQRDRKRHARENRPSKHGTWKCTCGSRHAIGTKCPKWGVQTGDKTYMEELLPTGD